MPKTHKSIWVHHPLFDEKVIAHHVLIHNVLGRLDLKVEALAHHLQSEAQWYSFSCFLSFQATTSSGIAYFEAEAHECPSLKDLPGALAFPSMKPLEGRKNNNKFLLDITNLSEVFSYMNDVSVHWEWQGYGYMNPCRGCEEGIKEAIEHFVRNATESGIPGFSG